MSRHIRTKQVLMACQMSFEGLSGQAIARILGVTEPTVTNWRKSDVWIEFEAELVDGYKQQALGHKPRHVSTETATASAD